MDKFCVLQPEGGITSGGQWATASSFDPPTLGNSQKCPVCGKPVTARRWMPPHQVKLSRARPSKWGDFMWGPASSLLVSQNFKQIYEQEGLTGISSFSDPVEIIRMGSLKNGQFPAAPPVYQVVKVLWGGANQDDKASGLKLSDPLTIKCTHCRFTRSGRKQDRVIIEPGTWNGKDVFIPRNAPVPFLVTERFKQVVEDHHLTNAWFIPTEYYAYDSTRWGQWYVNGMPEVADRADHDDDAVPTVDDNTEQDDRAGLSGSWTPLRG